MEIEEAPQTKKRNLLAKRLSRFGTNGKKLTTMFSFTNFRRSTYSLIFTSNREKDDNNTLVLQLGRFLFKFGLPKFIEPFKVGVFQETWGASSDEKHEVKKRWTFAYAPRIFGVGYLPKEKVFHFFYGVQSGNSKGFPKDKFKVWIPPFVKYHLITHQIIGSDNEVFWKNVNLDDKLRQSKLAVDIIGSVCPKVRFKATDGNGYEILGSAYCEEKEWARGVFINKKLRYAIKKISRRVIRLHLQTQPNEPNQKPTSQMVDFSMLPGENIENAIVRFCSIHRQEGSPHSNLSLVEIVR